MSARLQALLLALLVLIRDSTNYKIRTQAAVALRALECRQLYGDLLPDAVAVLLSALETLQGTAGGSASSMVQDNAGGGVQAIGVNESSSSRGSSVGGDSGLLLPPFAASGGRAKAGDDDGKFPNFRWVRKIFTCP